MGRMAEGAAYAITQIWRDANYLHEFGYIDAAAALSYRSIELWPATGGPPMCAGCGLPDAAPDQAPHAPWCARAGSGWYDPTEELREDRELAQLAALWDDPDTPAIFGEPGTRDRGAA